MPSVIIETHGCKLNQADSQVLARQFTQAGYQVMDNGQLADVYVLNTCTVTHIADRKSRRALRSARRRNPGALIVATGCYAERGAAILQAFLEVDLVRGNTDKESLVREVCNLRQSVEDYCVAEGEPAVGVIVRRARAIVRVQEGCDQVCAYCVVPKVRGRERSVVAEEVANEVVALEQEGFREVVLTGTELSSYGSDKTGDNLAGLLGLILNKTAIPRIRVSSLQPQSVDDGLLSLWRDSRLCPHFHMPLQSGSDALLKRMGRRYSTELFAEAVERVRRCVPGVSVTTDVLVGFPGESDAEFQETYDFCRDMHFSAMHVFPYSVRPGTSAAFLKNRVDNAVKEHREALLLALARGQAREFRQSLVGQVRPVLWERRGMKDGRARWSGLTDNYVRVFTVNAKPMRNTITPTRLLEERDGLLIGLVV